MFIRDGDVSVSGRYYFFSKYFAFSKIIIICYGINWAEKRVPLYAKGELYVLNVSYLLL